MPSFFESNADLFSLDPGTRKKTMLEDLAERRQQWSLVNPSAAAQMPDLPGQPQPSQPQPLMQPRGGIAGQEGVPPRPMGLAETVNTAAQALAQRAAAAETPPGEKPKPKAEQDKMSEFKALLDELNPLKPKETWGPNIGQHLGVDSKAGGILGLGITPIDVLAFAAGAAITGNLPQDRAMSATMAIAKLPSELREKQTQTIKDFIGNKLSLLNAEIAGGNLEINQVKSAQAQQQFGAQNRLAAALRLAGNEAGALALEAGAVDDFVKLTGTGVGRLPEKLDDEIDNILANPSAPLPDWAVARTGGRTPDEVRQGLYRWRAQMLGSKAPTALPSGGALSMTPSGPRIVERAPSVDTMSLPGAAVMRPGAAPVAQPSMPQLPQAPQTQPNVAGVQGIPLRPEETPGVTPRTATTSQRGMSLSDWVIQGGTPESTLETLKPLFAKDMDATARDKLVASHGTMEYAKELAKAYEAAVKSVGGERNWGLFSERARQHIIQKGGTVGGESTMQQILGELGAWGRAMAQEGATEEQIALSSVLDRAQTYARGALNDSANLAVRERQFFMQMLGTMLDQPRLVRRNLDGFYKTSARNFNSILGVVDNRNTGEFKKVPESLSGFTTPAAVVGPSTPRPDPRTDKRPQTENLPPPPKGWRVEY